MDRLVFTDAETVINDFGGAPVCTHNRGCVVCRQRKAVYNLSSGIFQPCWTCQDLQRAEERARRRAWMPWWLKCLFR